MDSEVVYEECLAKTILVKSGIYDVDYTVNPYFGCAHGCIYCYARFMFIRRNLDPNNWGKYVCAKINAPKLLRNEIKKHKRGIVLLSSVTDPYQPIERKYQLTRQILKIFLQHKYPVVILTKSDMVLRDIDILKKFEQIEVGLTITTLNTEDAKYFEPRATSPDKRLRALEELSKYVDTYAFIGPYLPFISDKTIEDLMISIKEIGVKRIIFDKLNLKSRNWETIYEGLRNYDENIKRAFRKKANDNNYWLRIKKKIMYLSSKYKIPVSYCY